VAAVLAACVSNAPPAGPLPRFAEFDGREVTAVRFEGDLAKVPRDSVAAVVATRPTRCRPFKVLCLKKARRHLDLSVLSRDVVRVQILFRDYGYYGTRVVPNVTSAGGDDVHVTLTITPGDRVTLSSLEVQGMEGITDTTRLRKRLPLKTGEPFRRRDFIASADTVRAELLQHGYAYGQVLRNYNIDTIADVATASFQAAPGPLVRVDTVLFEGLYRLEEKIARRELTFREGDLLRTSDLAQSQRNLFDLELVGFASVEIAPDSLQISTDSLELQPDSIGTTVLVRVVEAARFAAETTAGYGTRDCFRAQASRVDRNFLGGARRLEVSGSLAKIGVGGPLNLQDNFICGQLRPDSNSTPLQREIATALNYRLAVDFLQPRLFGTRTSVVAQGYAERTSEIGLYLRESVGGQLGVRRRIAPRTILTTTVDVQHGRTQAPDAIFCRGFEVCDTAAIAALSKSRWTNSLTAGLLVNRTRGGASPTGGYVARSQADFASPLLGSDDRYLRGLAEGAIYRQVRPGWVLSGRIQAGSFFANYFGEPADYVPPERRFYGGGPNSVRGYGLNRLGPQVYTAPADTSVNGYDSQLRASATGGTRILVTSGELSFPSPFYPNLLRLAAFVDAGQVWDTRNPGGDPRTANERGSLGLRVTPGVGMRLQTLVGPIRVDVAYNPYRPEEGPLYVFDNTGRLELVNPRFRQPTPSFLHRLTVSLAVGNAF
jgi:outer membrane protein assembly complex protein YaeT